MIDSNGGEMEQVQKGVAINGSIYQGIDQRNTMWFKNIFTEWREIVFERRWPFHLVNGLLISSLHVNPEASLVGVLAHYVNPTSWLTLTGQSRNSVAQPLLDCKPQKRHLAVLETICRPLVPLPA